MELKRFLHSWLNRCLTKGWILPEAGGYCYKTHPPPLSFPERGWTLPCSSSRLKLFSESDQTRAEQLERKEEA